jgi:(p)ppGpp synthase/HD superfamily hydrolase
MTENERILADLVLAPYIIKASALIGKGRRVGGNQFRHAFATLGILLDYKYFSNSVLLKASVIHDLIEEVPATNLDELRSIDGDSPEVVDLVLEVTRREGETKADYLRRLLETGSMNAKTLKVVDRISNLTDLNSDSTSEDRITNYLDETEKFVVPMARLVNHDMVIELTDLIKHRRKLIQGTPKSII